MIEDIGPEPEIERILLKVEATRAVYAFAKQSGHANALYAVMEGAAALLSDLIEPWRVAELFEHYARVYRSQAEADASPKSKR